MSKKKIINPFKDNTQDSTEYFTHAVRRGGSFVLYTPKVNSAKRSLAYIEYGSNLVGYKILLKKVPKVQ